MMQYSELATQNSQQLKDLRAVLLLDLLRAVSTPNVGLRRRRLMRKDLARVLTVLNDKGAVKTEVVL